jgi:hypothetical protein
VRQTLPKPKRSSSSSKEVLAKSVCQNGAKEEYQDTRLNRQQLEGLSPLRLEIMTRHTKENSHFDIPK